MASSELSDAIRTLKAQRDRALNEAKRLDRAIRALGDVSSSNAGASSTNDGRRRTLSAAARRKIAKAQKARWARYRQQQASKS